MISLDGLSTSGLAILCAGLIFLNVAVIVALVRHVRDEGEDDQ